MVRNQISTEVQDMQSLLLHTMMAISPVNGTPVPTMPDPNLFPNPVIAHQSVEGEECIKQVLSEQSPYTLYDFEGPRRRSDNVVEYWVWTYLGRWIAHGIEIETSDGSFWNEYYAAEMVTYAAPSAFRQAKVFEVLRGGDLGNYQFSIDLERCAPFLRSAPTHH